MTWLVTVKADALVDGNKKQHVRVSSGKSEDGVSHQLWDFETSESDVRTGKLAMHTVGGFKYNFFFFFFSSIYKKFADVKCQEHLVSPITSIKYQVQNNVLTIISGEQNFNQPPRIVNRCWSGNRPSVAQHCINGDCP